MIASMAMKSTLGIMTANSTRASGRMASNMERVTTDKMTTTEEAYGRTTSSSSDLVVTMLDRLPTNDYQKNLFIQAISNRILVLIYEFYVKYIDCKQM